MAPEDEEASGHERPEVASRNEVASGHEEASGHVGVPEHRLVGQSSVLCPDGLPAYRETLRPHNAVIQSSPFIDPYRPTSSQEKMIELLYLLYSRTPASKKEGLFPNQIQPQFTGRSDETVENK